MLALCDSGVSRQVCCSPNLRAVGALPSYSEKEGLLVRMT